MFSVRTTLEEFENEGFTLKTHQMFSIYTAPEEFKNGGFTQKTYQMFSIHTMPRKLENATNPGRFGFVFDCRDPIVSEIVLRPHEKEKLAFSNFSGLKSV